MKKSPRQIAAVLAAALLLQVPGFVLGQLVPQAFHDLGSWLRLLVYACSLLVTLPLFIRAYGYYRHDDGSQRQR